MDPEEFFLNKRHKAKNISVFPTMFSKNKSPFSRSNSEINDDEVNKIKTNNHNVNIKKKKSIIPEQIYHTTSYINNKQSSNQSNFNIDSNSKFPYKHSPNPNNNIFSLFHEKFKEKTSLTINNVNVINNNFNISTREMNKNNKDNDYIRNDKDTDKSKIYNRFETINNKVPEKQNRSTNSIQSMSSNKTIKIKEGIIMIDRVKQDEELDNNISNLSYVINREMNKDSLLSNLNNNKLSKNNKNVSLNLNKEPGITRNSNNCFNSSVISDSKNKISMELSQAVLPDQIKAEILLDPHHNNSNSIISSSRLLNFSRQHTDRLSITPYVQASKIIKEEENENFMNTYTLPQIKLSHLKDFNKNDNLMQRQSRDKKNSYKKRTKSNLIMRKVNKNFYDIDINDFDNICDISVVKRNENNNNISNFIINKEKNINMINNTNKIAFHRPSKTTYHNQNYKINFNNSHNLFSSYVDNEEEYSNNESADYIKQTIINNSFDFPSKAGSKTRNKTENEVTIENSQIRTKDIDALDNRSVLNYNNNIIGMNDNKEITNKFNIRKTKNKTNTNTNQVKIINNDLKIRNTVREELNNNYISQNKSKQSNSRNNKKYEKRHTKIDKLNFNELLNNLNNSLSISTKRSSKLPFANNLAFKAKEESMIKNDNEKKNLLILKKKSELILDSNIKDIEIQESLIEKRLLFIDDIMSKEKKTANDFELSESFIRIKTEDFNTCLFTLASIASSLIYYEIKTFGEAETDDDLDRKQNIENLLLIMITIMNLLFIVSTTLRYLLKIDLDRKEGTNLTIDNLLSHKYIWYYIMEIILAILHPNILLKDTTYVTDKTFYLLAIEYHVNDFLIVFSFIRIYTILRLMLSMSEFYSARALRVSQMVGSSLTEEFAIKSVLKKYPFFFLIMIAGLFLLVVSTATRIIEGPTYELRVDQSNDIYKVDDFRNFSNCLWFVLVTLTTVGYGDFTTVTNLGRFMSLMNAVWGNLILSVVILSLQNSLNFIRNEERAYGDILEEKILQELENESGRLFSLSFKYYSAKKEYKMLLKEEYLEEKIKRKNSINHAYLFQRSNTLDEESIRNLDHSRLNNLEKVKVSIAKTKKDLTRILYQKIIQEKRFFSKLKEYRNNFGYLTEDKVLLSQVNKLYDFREKAQEKIGYMDLNIRDIASTLNSIEILLQQKHEESENKKTLNSNKFKDIMLSSSLKSKSDDKDDARKLNRDTYDTSF